MYASSAPTRGPKKTPGSLQLIGDASRVWWVFLSRSMTELAHPLLGAEAPRIPLVDNRARLNPY